MRRVLPWALLLLLGIGTGVSAAMGAAGSPSTTSASTLAGPAAQQWLTGVLAATRASGTAHLDWVSVTRSPNPDTRGSGDGSGVVNFATGDFRVSQTEHSIGFSSENGGPLHPRAQTSTNQEIAIGRSVYENFGLPGFPDSWSKQSFPRDFGVLGLGSADGFGSVLSPLGKPFSAVAVTDGGAAVVGGAPATRYLVEIQAERRTSPGCPKSSSASKKTRTTPPTGNVSIWVDDQGRLVQARVISSLSRKTAAAIAKQDPSAAAQPAAARAFSPFTVTSTLRVSQLGEPVHIVRPPPGRGSGSTSVIGGYSSSTGAQIVFCG